MSETKTCPRCGETKPIEEFAINNTTPKKIYRKRHCKICYQKLWEERKLIRQSAPPPPEDSICQCCGKEKKLKTLLKQVLFLLFFIFGIKALSYGHADFSFKGVLATELFNLGTPENPVAFTFSSILFLLIVFVIARFVVTLFRIFIHRSTKTRAWIDEGRRYTFIQLTKYFVYTIAITIAKPAINNRSRLGSIINTSSL